jgi:hypothetical protein
MSRTLTTLAILSLLAATSYGQNSSPDQAETIKKVYSGSATHGPLALMSSGMQLEAVRSQKGGIAPTNADVKDGVKVIKIDGLAPGSAGYPFK